MQRIESGLTELSLSVRQDGAGHGFLSSTSHEMFPKDMAGYHANFASPKFLRLSELLGDYTCEWISSLEVEGM